MTLVISYSTPVRSSPRQTMASGGVRVASTALPASLMDAQQAAYRFDHRHTRQDGERVLDGGFAGDVGGQHDLGAGHIVAENNTFFLDDAGQANAVIAEHRRDGGHDTRAVDRQKAQEVTTLEQLHRSQRRLWTDCPS